MTTGEPFSKTLVVWWRYGKEHGGGDFRANPPDVIRAHIQRKIDRFRTTPEDDWLWWRVAPGLIIERPPATNRPFGDDTRIFYLLEKGFSIIENVHLPPPDDRWKWYIHISDFAFDAQKDCWLMKDLFCDIMVEHDNRTYHLYDLPVMAQALDVGLITAEQSSQILKRIGWMVNAIASGEFPPGEILRGRAAAEALGW